MIHNTMQTFGYPDTLIKAYQHWVVQLRPKQITLGSLALICTEEVTAFSMVSGRAMVEFQQVINDIEGTLKKLFSYDKINYLMLMMADPHVHFHVIPRYESVRTFHDTIYKDTSWPGPPNFTTPLNTDNRIMGALIEALREQWQTK